MCKRNIDPLHLTHPQLDTWPATLTCALTGNQTRALSVCGTTPNVLSHTSQGACGSFVVIEYVLKLDSGNMSEFMVCKLYLNKAVKI